MSRRNEKAIEVLENGGFFRKALERNYHGGETFVTRLYTADRQVVKGIGTVTRIELEEAGLLERRPCVRSSVWPEEWTLRARAAA
jgi:hypothetical protein